MNQRAGSERPISPSGSSKAFRVSVPGGDVKVVAGRPSSLRRPADEGGDEPIQRGGLLDRELQQVRLVGGRERVCVARVDLPLRRVVLVVDAEEREPEPAHVVFHLADDALGVGPNVHAVDEPGGGLVGQEPPLRRPAQQEELELVADGDVEPLRLGGGDRPAEDVAGIGLERLAVEPAVGQADRGLPLPRDDAEGVEIGDDLHVAEVDLVANPGPVGHHSHVVDGEDRDAEVEPVVARVLEDLERDHLRARRADQVRVVHADASDARVRELTQLVRDHQPSSSS